jgi:hypothetical protein
MNVSRRAGRSSPAWTGNATVSSAHWPTFVPRAGFQFRFSCEDGAACILYLADRVGERGEVARYANHVRRGESKAVSSPKKLTHGEYKASCAPHESAMFQRFSVR